MTRRFLALFLLLFLSAAAAADEGMWLFNAAPKQKIKAKYGFEPSDAWLDHVRLSSVRFNNGGSGSFVSADGLTFTNHHVGAGCVQSLSTGGKDYMKSGFYARTRAEEAKCPDLELNVLMSIEDVTDKVSGAAKPDMSVAEAGQAQRAIMSAIEKECADSTHLRCDVITLYSGGRYHLYKYKKYTDVRLVFAPEFMIAFFGGDPDNFEFPRYDLDITFFRVYENDKPANLTHFFNWTRAGVRDGDLVFVPGNPGSTGRDNTLAQMEFARDVNFPFLLKTYKQRLQALKAFAAGSEENARIAREDIFSIENSFKAVTGYQGGLLDPALMAKKADAEKKLRAAVETDPAKKQQFGAAWDEVAQAMAVSKQIYLPLTFLERRAGFRGNLTFFARALLRATAEKQKPNGERMREYRDSGLASLEQQLFSTAPVYKALETVILTESLAEMQENLGADHPAVKQALGGRTPAEVAKDAIANTKLDDVALRKHLYQGGVAAVDASTDSLIVLMRSIDGEARKVRKQYDDQVDAVVRRNGALLAKARFAAGGLEMPPDATFTLRLSYGDVRGFVEDGQGIVPEGTHVPYFTTMGGAYKHAAEKGNTDPYQLPESWMKNKGKVNLSTPLNFTSTPDIIGGNSGSPVVNKAGEVVGIIFDGNIQSLPWNFMYSDDIGRSVSVDARGISEALRSIYGATELADELAGPQPKAKTKPMPKAKPAAAVGKD
ncbi:MAG TPA: S46 family peptidase [Terriglobales bacterium]|nr:S46 family peptidase [Terriglobales bacterium]